VPHRVFGVNLNCSESVLARVRSIRLRTNGGARYGCVAQWSKFAESAAASASPEIMTLLGYRLGGGAPNISVAAREDGTVDPQLSTISISRSRSAFTGKSRRCRQNTGGSQTRVP